MKIAAASLLLTLALLAAGVRPAGAASLPPGLLAQAAWQQQGAGEARWFGLRLYEAALWAPASGWQPDARFALSLRYARDFSAARLVDTSIDEIARLFESSPAELARWREALMQAFPDVRAGDVLVGEFRPGGGAAFYFGDRLHFETADQELARRFFAIWLDPRTRVPELREKLLGLTPGG